MRVCVLALALTLSLSPSSAFIPSVAPLSGVSKAPAAAFPLRTRTVATSATWKAQLAFPNLFGSKPGTATRDAKSELIDLVLSTSRFGTDLSDDVAGQVEGLIQALQARKKGFQRATADGDWALIYEINSDGSPALQKFSQNFESVGGSFANFDVSKNEFYNIANLFGGKGKLMATVEFGEVESQSSSSRISCDIVDASIQLGPLPALPLPLRASGGWLDFLYLDQDLRITRGNRGGLFIHVRPEILQQKLAQ